CPADDCFNFMRRKVLRFIYNKKYFAQRTAADEGQRRYRDLLIGYQFINFSLHFFIIAKLIFNKLQVVPNWRHVRVDFWFNITWQKANILVAQRHYGACYEYLPEILALLQRSGQCQQGFARTRVALYGNQFYIRMQQRMDVKRLLHL